MGEAVEYDPHGLGVYGPDGYDASGFTREGVHRSGCRWNAKKGRELLASLYDEVWDEIVRTHPAIFRDLEGRTWRLRIGDEGDLLADPCDFDSDIQEAHGK